MPRRPREQAPGGIYHVTSRGNRGQATFVADNDRVRFLGLLEAVSRKASWTVHAYCLMQNHYHLVVEIGEPTLSSGLQRLNGAYAQAFNRRHGYIGHLFQGRFHSVRVETDPHLLELARYLPLNPVRARLCDDPADWPWSSYRATLGIGRPAPFLAVDRVLGLFALDRRRAREAFRAFVATPRL
ncbi:MAG TPA: transposase [Gaiellaceae bacterium]|nr:transposase [Gaiellaceae bacterium]